MKLNQTINAVLDDLASQQRQGESSLIVKIEPGLIQEAMNALPGYQTFFAPFIPGQTDLAPISQVYERMRDAAGTKSVVLLLVKSQSIEEFREALNAVPLRHSSEWRDSFDEAAWRRFFKDSVD